MTERNSRSFDAIPRVIANREREKMKAHSPTLGSPRFGATHAPLGARDIPIVLPGGLRSENLVALTLSTSGVR